MESHAAGQQAAEESKIVLIHSDKRVRKVLEAKCSVHHKPIAVADGKSGLEIILKTSPAQVASYHGPPRT